MATGLIRNGQTLLSQKIVAFRSDATPPPRSLTCEFSGQTPLRKSREIAPDFPGCHRDHMPGVTDPGGRHASHPGSGCRNPGDHGHRCLHRTSSGKDGNNGGPRADEGFQTIRRVVPSPLRNPASTISWRRHCPESVRWRRHISGCHPFDERYCRGDTVKSICGLLRFLN